MPAADRGEKTEINSILKESCLAVVEVRFPTDILFPS
jgi:hypothetical protein